MKLNLKEIKNENLNYVQEYFPEKYEKHKINEMNSGIENGEHYKLLSYLSNLFENEVILDLGTRDGLSALILSKNNKNKVITYDLLPKPNEMTQFEELIPNCEFKQMNVFDESNEIIKTSKLIFLDLDPHDGIQELKFMQLLESINYEGIVICDDIEWFPAMAKWWSGVRQTKYNVTKYGHGSGTGIIDFSNKLELIYE
jgi:predicted O-methyltransferase YrrM